MNFETKHSSRPAGIVRLAVLIGAAAISPLARAADTSPPVAQKPETPQAIFDRATDLLQKDPLNAKLQFAQAAAMFEEEPTAGLSRASDGRLWYDAGASRQLAGDLGHAVLDLRRAEFDAPLTPGLHERLGAARAAVRGDTRPAAPKEPDYRELAQDAGLSVPRELAWSVAVAIWIGFWGVVAVRLASPAWWRWRPRGGLVVASAIVCLCAGAAVAALWHQDVRASHEVVVLADTVGRTTPDDLTGPPAPGAAFKPGAELEEIEERTGGDGQPWLHVRPADAPPELDQSSWVPRSSVGRVVE